MNRKSATRKGFVAAAALSAVIGLSACGTNDVDTAQADSSSTSVSVPKPAAVVRAIPGGDTAVTLDSGFVSALGTLGLTPGVTGTATLDGTTGVVDFPITGGTVTLYDRETGYRPWVQGVLFHEGSGLSLTAGGTEVELTDFVIDPGTSELTGTVSVDGKEAATDALLFDLDGSTLNPLETNSDGSATLEGTTVTLSDDAAGLRNDTFGIEDLKGGLVIGISSITVK